MQKPLVDEKIFPALTGIRTVAALMVFFSHYNSFQLPFFASFIHEYLGEFHVGVTIFFVLSGFLIYYRYGEKIATGNIRLRDYFVNRFARIYPMYFIVTVVCFLPFACHCLLKDNIPLFLLNLSFLRGFFDEYKFTGAATGWSLTVEEMFYFLFPLIIFISRKIRILFQPLLLLGSGLLLWFIFRDISFHGFFSSLQFLFEFTFFGRCVEFYAGILLAVYVRKNGRMMPQDSNYYRTATGAIYIMLCIWLLALNKQHSADFNRFLLLETLLNNFLLPPGIALFFFGLIREKTVLRKILETGPILLFGKSSYIFYLIHNGILFTLLYFNVWHEKLILVLISEMIISILLYLCIEKPLNRWIRGKFSSTAA